MADDYVHILSVEGQFDISSREQFFAALQPALEHARVILDCTKLRYVDSTCLTVLVEVRKRRQVMGYPPAHIVGLSSGLRRMFEISGLNRLWPLNDSIEQAQALLETVE
jgi:anti-anti-sigma factor